MEKTKLTLYKSGLKAQFFVKENGKLIAGFSSKGDAEMFLDAKSQRKGGSTVEDQTG